ncbi:hypothetical protein [Streptomyces sp. AC550_RSS872]|uniref:hypothetical protein n=1 Tax=Streptomyces sp. AC550_RSS872 TaxID=2823689 RepID=UPI001C27D9F6|nr:hypothetical protein [Streptomyces sp. AC550_RSS872]
MRSHRTTPARVFSGLSAALLRDRSISWPALSVLAYLLALPIHTRVTLRALTAPCVEGRSRVVAALRELEERRYLRRVVRDGGEGGAARQLSVVYEVFDAPYEAEPPMGEFEKVGDRHAPSRWTVRAAHLLISLRNIDPRLTLDGAEALRLAPLVEEWWERGRSSSQVRAALAYGWPGPVHSASAHIEACLLRGRPAVPTSLPVTAVEVEFRRTGAFAWREVLRRGGGLARVLLKGRAVPA